MYQERVKPANMPPDVVRLTTVTHEALTGNREYVKVSVALKNIGQNTAELGGLVINVYGTRYTQRIGDAVKAPTQGLVARNLGLAKTKPVLLYSFFDIWRPLGNDRTFLVESGQDVEESFNFAFHAGEYDAAALEMFHCYTRPGSRVWPARRETRADGSYLARFAGPSQADHPGLTCRKQTQENRL